MKLTKEKIKFIDDYLIKNKVKFWDVRLELIDHIATAVEDRMKDGQSFEDAMFEMHGGFGNDVNKARLNVDNTKWITTRTLFHDSEGFEKLLNEKRNAVSKKVGRLIWKYIGQFFKAPLTALLYLICVFWSAMRFNEEGVWVAMFGLGSILIPFMAYSIFKSARKSHRDSLVLGRVYWAFGAIAYIFLYYIPLFTFDFLFDEVSAYKHSYYAIVSIVLLPFVYGVFKTYLQIEKQQKEYYDLTIAQ